MAKKKWILWQFAMGYHRQYFLGVVAMSIATLLLYLAPLVTRGAIDGLLDQPKPGTAPSVVVKMVNFCVGESAGISSKLAIAGGMLLALMVGHGVFSYVRARITAQASETIAREMRNKLYDQLQHVPCSYHDKAQTGDLVQRCTSDVETVKQFFASQLIEIQRAILLILIVVPMLLWIDWREALIALALVPVMIGFAVVFFSKVRTSFKAMDEAEGAMTSVLQENLTGIRVVRAFARHDFEIEKFREKNRKHRDLNFRLIRLMAFYWPLADYLTFMQMAVVLLSGAARVAHGSMTIGDLVAFQTYVGMYVWPLRQMGKVVADLGKSTISAVRIQEILDQPREINPPTVPTELPFRVSGRIELKDVSFQHGESKVLQNINLSIPAGETLAILGPSGSGKSTLIHLLLRFYDYGTGSIKLDGWELNTLDRKYVRRQFGVVMQEPFLYSKTLRDNIRIGQPEAAEEDMIASAEDACIHESITGFDKQYDTLVGERGVTLSGGQRQRVAIARALLKAAPILVLDDALSAVDMHTENQIRHALQRRRGRQTTLLIAHRLSTLMYADRIIVLEGGKITQCGTHEELVAREGLYRRLWLIQSDLEDNLRQELNHQKTNTTASINAGAAGAGVIS